MRLLISASSTGSSSGSIILRKPFLFFITEYPVIPARVQRSTTACLRESESFGRDSFIASLAAFLSNSLNFDSDIPSAAATISVVTPAEGSTSASVSASETSAALKAPFSTHFSKSLRSIFLIIQSTITSFDFILSKKSRVIFSGPFEGLDGPAPSEIVKFCNPARIEGETSGGTDAAELGRPRGVAAGLGAAGAFGRVPVQEDPDSLQFSSSIPVTGSINSGGISFVIVSSMI